MKRILVIPDLQVKPLTPVDHLRWIGQYMVDKKPDLVVQLGDMADMESLSSYDVGKKRHEGKRYKLDIDAARNGMRELMAPLHQHNAVRKMWKEKLYRPELHLVLGNHENRIDVAVEADAKMEGVISIDDLGYADHGWNVHPFLQPVVLCGISFCHYFCNSIGKPWGGASIDTRLKNVGFSFVAGHQQTYLVGCRNLNNGQRIRGLVCGAAYIHDEDYRGPQTQAEWRGVFLLHECHDGDYGLCEVSLDYLCRRYEGMRLHRFVKAKYPEVFKKSLWMKRQEAIDDSVK